MLGAADCSSAWASSAKGSYPGIQYFSDVRIALPSESLLAIASSGAVAWALDLDKAL